MKNDSFNRNQFMMTSLDKMISNDSIGEIFYLADILFSNLLIFHENNL